MFFQLRFKPSQTCWVYRALPAFHFFLQTCLSALCVVLFLLPSVSKVGQRRSHLLSLLSFMFAVASLEKLYESTVNSERLTYSSLSCRCSHTLMNVCVCVWDGGAVAHEVALLVPLFSLPTQWIYLNDSSSAQLKVIRCSCCCSNTQIIVLKVIFFLSELHIKTVMSLKYVPL